jgi:uncharacterized phosphosugar-binding protein
MIFMPKTVFFRGLQDVLTSILETQAEAIDTASEWAAEAIAADRFALMVGTGHSFLVTADAFPRIGSYPGWLPLHELSTSYTATIAGNQGLRQVLFLENLEGFGQVVLQNYRLDPRDVLFSISHSGVHALTIDCALTAKEQGLKTVAVTSLAQSKASQPKHSTGKRLFEVCDLVIDNGAPEGDSIVDVAGFPHKVGSLSTITACAIFQALVAETAKRLTERGVSLPQMAHDKQMLQDSIAEQVRRIQGFYQ